MKNRHLTELIILRPDDHLPQTILPTLMVFILVCKRIIYGPSSTRVNCFRTLVYSCINNEDQRVFQFEVIINVLVSYLHML